MRRPAPSKSSNSKGKTVNAARAGNCAGGAIYGARRAPFDIIAAGVPRQFRYIALRAIRYAPSARERGKCRPRVPCGRRDMFASQTRYVLARQFMTALPSIHAISDRNSCRVAAIHGDLSPIHSFPRSFLVWRVCAKHIEFALQTYRNCRLRQLYRIARRGSSAQYLDAKRICVSHFFP